MNRIITAGLGLALAASPLATTAAAHSAGAATASDARPAYEVSAKINKATALGGEVVKIRGKVSPRAVGETVILQQRVDGKRTWKKSGTAKIKRTGKFVLKDDPSTAGTRFYRVLKPASEAIAKGVSKEMKLVVYTWEPLVYRTAGPATGVSLQSATIATDSYSSSIVTQTAGTPGAIEYTLGGKCLALRATYALTDATATGGTGAVVLKKDGAVAFAANLVLGQVIKDNQVDLTGAFRISYELTSTATPAAFSAAAKPEVLCTD